MTESRASKDPVSQLPKTEDLLREHVISFQPFGEHVSTNRLVEVGALAIPTVTLHIREYSNGNATVLVFLRNALMGHTMTKGHLCALTFSSAIPDLHAFQHAAEDHRRRQLASDVPVPATVLRMQVPDGRTVFTPKVMRKLFVHKLAKRLPSDHHLYVDMDTLAVMQLAGKYSTHCSAMSFTHISTRKLTADFKDPKLHVSMMLSGAVVETTVDALASMLKLEFEAAAKGERQPVTLLLQALSAGVLSAFPQLEATAKLAAALGSADAAVPKALPSTEPQAEPANEVAS